MSNKQQIEKALKSLILADDREFVAMLSGEWGIGKTYFWNNLFVEKELKKSNIAYISLFGYSSLQSIKNDIIMKLSNTEKGKAVISEIFNNFRTSLGSREGDESSGLSLGGNLVSSALSAIPEKSLLGTLICFDDFERLSHKVSLKDIMGLISQFKEQKKCKVVMILNEGELSEDEQKVFAEGKEKIVDYNFYYQPSQEKLFEAIKEDIVQLTLCDKETIYGFFRKIDLKNIRIMKQALYQLKHFNFIKDNSFDEKVVNEFVEISLNLFVFKATTNYSYSKFKKIIKYHTKKNIATQLSQKIKIKPNYEKALKSLNNLGFIYLKQELEAEVYTYIDTHIINEETINTLLKNKDSNINFKKIHDDITSINHEYTVSFATIDKDTSKRLIDMIREYSDSLHLIFTYGDFQHFLQNTKKYASGLSIDASTDKTIVKSYIKYYTDNPEKDHHGPLNNDSYMKKILMEYAWAQSFFDDYKKNTLNTSVSDIPRIMKEVCQTRHSSDKQLYQLNLFSKKDYKSIIIKSNSYDFINTIVQFCSRSISGADIDSIKTKIAQALKEIGNINDEYKRKTEDIAKHAELKLVEKE